MKHTSYIKHKGIKEQVVIETSVYQGKQMFEIAYKGQFIIVYKEGDNWLGQDNEPDREWLNAVGAAIENLPEMVVNSI